MSNTGDQLLFNRLFREAYRRYFSRELKEPLTEAEGKIFCVDIEEKTGLVIGFKSMKNYSLYLTSETTGRRENPSLATLDTLARYVLNAPPTSEQDRKRDEGHYPYWYLYQKKHPFTRKATGLILPELIAQLRICLYAR
jgi:transcriptional regulator with XRE-family HTH domain